MISLGRSRLLLLALTVWLSSTASIDLILADSAAAERQFRVARRLAAEGASGASEALARVIELDPNGPLADDAMIESALLEGVARWPEETGRISADGARRAERLLDRVLGEFARADRVTEAGYYRALLSLEPLPGHFPDAARRGLIEISATPTAGEWGRRARYARAWIDEHGGRRDAAAHAYQRLWVDERGTPASIRALARIGRMTLREGDAADAAVWLEQAVEADAGHALGSEPLRELAVRAAFARLPGLSGQAEIVAAGAGVRSVSGWVALPDGGMALAGRKGREVQRYDASGRVASRWELEGTQALTATALGRLYAATSDAVYLLVRGEPARRVAGLGSFGAPGAMAADDGGTLYLTDRKGEFVATVPPGADQPLAGTRLAGVKLAGLVWDGLRLISVDTRGKRVVSVEPSGSVRSIADGLDKPDALAIDAAGRIALIESRSGSVLFFDRNGEGLGTWAGRDAGVQKAIALAFSADGSLQLFDAANETWVRLR